MTLKVILVIKNLFINFLTAIKNLKFENYLFILFEFKRAESFSSQGDYHTIYLNLNAGTLSFLESLPWLS